MTELSIHAHETGPLKTGIAISLLAEVAEHLAQFAKTGTFHKIDLKSLPMTPADLEDLDDRLGVGEVRADLAVIGRSEVWESTYAGVWRVRHYGSGDAPVANEIFIGQTPDILFSHADDARAAAERLRADATELDNEPCSEDAAHV